MATETIETRPINECLECTCIEDFTSEQKPETCAISKTSSTILDLVTSEIEEVAQKRGSPCDASPLNRDPHRYQTTFLFAQRPYSSVDGIVSKIGGGPDEQFW